MMRDHLSRAIRFEKYDARAKKIVAADPPHDLANILLSRDGDWQLRHLTGIIVTPTLRSDGSILVGARLRPGNGVAADRAAADAGYPAKPSRDDALAALELLESLLAEFPFVDKASRSVGLSALITPVVRGAMQAAPLHALTAPEAGSGKSYLIDIASAIATGEIAPVIAAGRDEEETEKRLAAELLTGQNIVSIDNFNGDLAGDFICQAVERPVIKPRILGRSETKRIENTVVMFANGNNMRLVGDIIRRTILCSLNAEMERPERRSFRHIRSPPCSPTAAATSPPHSPWPAHTSPQDARAS